MTSAVIVLRDTLCVDANPAAVRLFGVGGREELVGRTPLDFAPSAQPDGTPSADAMARAIDEARRRGAHAVKWVAVRESGDRFTLQVRLSPFLVAGVEHLCCIADPVSERERTEELLALQRELGAALNDAGRPGDVFGLLLDAVMKIPGVDAAGVYRLEPDGSLVLDRYRNLSAAFAAGAARFGPGTPQSAAARAGMPFYRFSIDRTSSHAQEAIRSEGIRALAVLPLRHGSRVVGVVNVASRTMPEIPAIAHGVLDGMTAQTAGAIARLHAVAALEESERSLKTLLGNLPGMAYRCRNDASWTLEYASEGAAELTGHTAAELVAGTCPSYGELIHPDDRQAVWSAVQKAVAAREKFTLTYRLCPAGARERWVWEQGQGVFAETGELLALEGFVTDVTERRLLEEERSKSHKLEAIGTLAGGIAHDFNNLLQGIFGHITLARSAQADPKRCRAMLDEAERALGQAVGLTGQLLTFARGGLPVKRRLSVRPVVESATRLSLSGSTADFRFELDSDLRDIDADPGQVAQVLQNLVLNAAQAMGQGGTVVLGARNVSAPAPALPASLPAGDYVAITVTDQGVGIPRDRLPRMFDPYFTTKPHGTGLGLATSYSIVKRHGGLIDVRSELGRGSTFSIYLPVSREPAPDAEAPAHAARAGRRKRVLVMDDDEMVRSVGCKLLEVLGHEADAVPEGASAVRRCREARAEGRPFDLVILDLTVRGGMGGVDTVRELARLDERLAAVMSSGYSEDASIADYRRLGFAAFLKKPYTLVEMQAVLDELLGRSRGEP